MTESLILPFLPRHVRQKYRQQGELTHPVMEEMDFAVVGILDISGYSKLTTALSARGNIGAELLTRILNPYFTLMIETVEKYGGDIIKFAGDAIIVYWRPPKIPDQAKARLYTALRACRASLLLLAALGNYEVAIPQDNAIKASEESKHLKAPGSDKDKEKEKGKEKKDPNIIYLSMHIGLAYGRSFDVHVGLSGRRWEFFVAGDGIRKVAPILDEAKRGELAISADMMKLLKEDKTIEAIYTANVTEEFGILCGLNIPDEDVIIPSTEEIDGMVQPNEIHSRYINESALYRLKAGQAGLLNELRYISVIFLKIGDLDFDSDGFLTMTQLALIIALDALKEFEGSLRQMMMDDKGLTILAVFGLPPWSHENEATFALKAALQMHKRMKEGGFTSFSFGVASGVVFTGKVGSELRCDHTVLGDCVNMAARLMCSKLASNSILCDDATYQSAKQIFTFFTPEPILVKGKSFPIAVYKPEGERPQESRVIMSVYDPTFAATFVGRIKEREIIQKLVESYQFGSTNVPSSTLIIEGDAGQGKSRLGRFLINMALGAGLQVVLGQSSEVEKKTPAHTLRPVVMALIDIISKDSFKFNSEGYRMLKVSNPRHNLMRGQGDLGSTTSLNASAIEEDDEEERYLPSAPKIHAFRRASKEKTPMTSTASIVSATTSRDKRRESIKMQSALPSYRRPSIAFDAKQPGSNGTFDPNLKGVDPSLLKDEAGLAADSPDLKSRVRRLSVQQISKGVPPLLGSTSPKPSQASSFRTKPVGAAKSKLSNMTGTSHGAALTRWTMNEIPEDGDNGEDAGPSRVTSQSTLNGPSNEESQPSTAVPPVPIEPLVKVDEKSLTELEKLVLAASRSVAESDNYLSLFNLVLPVNFPKAAALNFNRTRQSETEALILLLARIILKIVASNGPMVIVLDDSHWQDSLSWHILSKLVKHCAFRVLFCIVSRPAKDFEEKLLMGQFESIKNMKRTQCIFLEGLSKEDTAQLTINKYGGNVKSIHQDLLEKIFSKTSGRAAFVESMTITLRESSITDVVAGELRLKNKNLTSAGFDDLIPSDIESAIRVQYDKMEQNMQTVLRVASVIGQYFSIQELATVLDRDLGREYSPEEIYDFLAQKDKFGFIAPQAAGYQSDRAEAVDLSTYAQQNTERRSRLGFQSSAIRQSIYNIMLFEHRENIHARIARYYESQSQEQSRFLLLPQIAYHYNQTSLVEKKVDYLEAVSFYDIDIFSMLEAISNLEALIEFADKKAGSAVSEMVFGAQRRRVWHRKLAQALAAQRLFEPAIEEHITVLEMLGVNWPSGKLSMSYAIWKYQRKQRKAWTRRISNPDLDVSTSNFLMGDAVDSRHQRKRSTIDSLPPMDNGRRRSGRTTRGSVALSVVSSSSASESHVVEEIIMTLSGLIELYWTQGQYSPAFLSLLLALNYCERMVGQAAEHPALLCRAAYIYAVQGKEELSAQYIAQAEKLLVMAPVLQELKVNMMNGQVYYTKSEWLNALNCFENVVLLAERTGQRVMWEEAHLMIENLWIFNGDFEEAIFSATHVYQDSLDHDDVMAATLHGIFVIQAFVAIDRIHEVPLWLERVVGLWPRVRDSASPACSALYYVASACASLRTRDDESAEDHLENAVYYTNLVVESLTTEPIIITAMFHFLLCVLHAVEEYTLAPNDAIEPIYNQRNIYLKSIIGCLKKVKIFKASAALLHLAEGAQLAFAGKKQAAAKAYNKGIACSCVQNDARYVLAVLLGEKAKVTNNNETLDIAQQLMEDIASSWELSGLVRRAALW